MDVAALLVSVVALVVAIGAAAYARQQARAADRQAKAAEEERHEQRTPDMAVTTEWIGTGYTSEIHVVFRLVTGPDLADVLAEIIHSDDPSGTNGPIPVVEWGLAVGHHDEEPRPVQARRGQAVQGQSPSEPRREDHSSSPDMSGIETARPGRTCAKRSRHLHRRWPLWYRSGRLRWSASWWS